MPRKPCSPSSKRKPSFGEVATRLPRSGSEPPPSNPEAPPRYAAFSCRAPRGGTALILRAVLTTSALVARDFPSCGRDRNTRVTVATHAHFLMSATVHGFHGSPANRAQLNHVARARRLRVWGHSHTAEEQSKRFASYSQADCLFWLSNTAALAPLNLPRGHRDRQA